MPVWSAFLVSLAPYLHHPLPQCPTSTSDILYSIISICTLSQIFLSAPYKASKLICYQTSIPTFQLPSHMHNLISHLPYTQSCRAPQPYHLHHIIMQPFKVYFTYRLLLMTLRMIPLSTTFYFMAISHFACEHPMACWVQPYLESLSIYVIEILMK